MKWTLRALAGLALAALLGIATAVAIGAGMGNATPGGKGGKVDQICATWQMRGATGAYPDVTFGGAPAGSQVRRWSATLAKPTGEGVVAPGVEFAAADLDIEAKTEIKVTARVLLTSGAKPDAGAVRMFGYSGQGADTLNDRPDWMVAVTGNGTFTFTIAAGERLGTLGFAYDASNDSTGRIEVGPVKIGRDLVRFTPCPRPDESQSGSPSPSTSASTKPTVTPSISVSPSRSTIPTPDPTEVEPSGPVTGGSLPITGPSGFALAGIGAAVLVGGVVLAGLARRRRIRFEE